MAGRIGLVLPDKHAFKIGEVARITGLKTHVLRYWETEFPQLRPGKTASKQRLYSRRDVEQILLIQQLVHRDGFTLAGARKRLRELGRAAGGRDESLEGLIAALRGELRRLLEALDED